MHEMYRNTYDEKHITLLAFNLFHLHIFLKYELFFTYRDILNMTHFVSTLLFLNSYILCLKIVFIFLCCQNVHQNIFLFSTTRNTSVNSDISLQTLFDFSLFSQKRQRLDINKLLLRRYVV